MYTVRKIQDSDAKEVSDLIIKTLRISNIKDYSKEFIENDVNKFTVDYVMHRAEKTHFYVVTESEKIIGCGAIGPYFDKENESMLHSIFVLPEYQGRGIGKMIIKTLESDKFFQRAKRIEIASSVTARNFYLKIGYRFKNGVTEIDEGKFYRLEKLR